jgi:hypothetical protein
MRPGLSHVTIEEYRTFTLDVLPKNWTDLGFNICHGNSHCKWPSFWEQCQSGGFADRWFRVREVTVVCPAVGVVLDPSRAINTAAEPFEVTADIERAVQSGLLESAAMITGRIARSAPGRRASRR